MHPLVSVIVPSYNHEAMVDECLASIASQTWPELELIAVDDASHDGTYACIEAAARGRRFIDRFHGRVTIDRNQTNQGSHRTLNRAIQVAAGEYVAIVNSDDRYAPDRVSTLVRTLEEAGSGFAFSAVRMIDSRGRDVTAADWYSTRISHTQRSIGAYPTVGFAALHHNVAISTGNFVFQRRLFDRIGGFRPLSYCLDWDFLLRALAFSVPVFVAAPLYEYRVHETNSFRSLRSKATEETEAVLTAYFSAVQAGRIENSMAPSP